MFAGAPKLVLARGGHVAAEGEVKAPKRVLAPFCHADATAHSANPNLLPLVGVGLVVAAAQNCLTPVELSWHLLKTLKRGKLTESLTESHLDGHASYYCHHHVQGREAHSAC